MSLMPEREVSELIDMADMLSTMEQSAPYCELVLWLRNNLAHECREVSNPTHKYIKTTTSEERAFLAGVQRGYSRGIHALSELRAHYEALAKREKDKDAGRKRAESRIDGRRVKPEYR